MKSALRYLILATTAVVSISIAHRFWIKFQSVAPERRINVSFLAFGYTLLIGNALYAATRIFERNAVKIQIWPLLLRIIAAIFLTIGNICGVTYVIKYNRLATLQRPVIWTDLFVLIFLYYTLIWLFRNRPITHFDLCLGLGSFATWYLATFH